MVKLRRIRSEISIIIMFILSSLFSLYISSNLIVSNPSLKGSGDAMAPVYIIYYLIAVIAFTVLILFLIKRYAKAIKYIFVLLIIYMIFFVSAIIAGIVSTSLIEYFSIILFITGLFAYLLIFHNEWYIMDAAGFLMVSGAAAVFGTFLNPYYAMVLLIAFAIYDYVSVYKTKHMVTLARAAVDNSYPLLFVMPSKSGLKLQNLTFDNRGENNVLMLGFGDMAIPEILIVSSYIFDQRLIFIILPLAGAIMALIVLFFFNNGKPAPGLPYINTGVIAGFLLSLLISFI
ncbi:presenilin family intramembrane aspartyl protease PSH [Picrophilus oshimae]|uniref:Conserved hypothetical membrane protein n=1 Tax=Picrophilus torridus (strain ATCC 700027 / DSM 9790 / JCM 10055 / NBRC 100828 / KAW 2/3) TaxID=1122961 RepID=Q6L121_PICTO|nr:presenilin family intramembrane aspartyl protease PSH [Picrophilus oshimae]AAT43331.1 conserved hypothetical membrane protein [Picrophilus oshimae DSM 9789]